jgi:hypothetical protein
MNLNRRVWSLNLAGFLVTLAMLGCAVKPEVIPITPDYPTLGTIRPTRFFVSSLVVSTETWIDPNLASGDDGAVIRPTGYRLYDAQGVEIMYVRNYIGTLDSVPTTLELEPGRYLVRPDKPGKRPPIFWVVLEPGKLTEVNLKK